MGKLIRNRSTAKKPMTVLYPVEIDGQQYTVTVSDEPEVLLAAQAAGRAVLGVWGDGKAAHCRIPVFAESWDCVSSQMAERAVRRKEGLPWIISVTERLRIREVFTGDWERLKETGPLTEWPDLPSLESYIKNQYGFYEYGLWLMEEKKTGLPAGRAGVWNPDEETCRRLAAAGELPEEYLELGYEVFPAFRGKGLAKEACLAIMGYADWELECRLCLRVSPENLPSQSLAKALGFSRLWEPERQRSPGRANPDIKAAETQLPFLYVWSC